MTRATLVTKFKEEGPKTAIGIQNLFSDGLFTMTILNAYAANKERGAVNAAASPDEGDSASDSESGSDAWHSDGSVDGDGGVGGGVWGAKTELCARRWRNEPWWPPAQGRRTRTP